MLNKKLKLFFVFTIGIILLFGNVFGICIAYYIKVQYTNCYKYWNYATNPAYQIFIEKGQIPYQATCTVMDSQGHPIPGMIVALGGYSGTREDMITNDQGQVTQSCIEDVIIQIWVNGIYAFAIWDIDNWYQPSYMSVEKGLMIKIIMMDLGNEPKNQIPSQ